MKKYGKQENKAVKIVHFWEQSFTYSTVLLTIKAYIKKLPRINRGNHIQQILVAVIQLSSLLLQLLPAYQLLLLSSSLHQNDGFSWPELSLRLYPYHKYH